MDLVFESHRDGNGEIYRMKADGTMPTNLTNAPGNEGSPDWAVCPAP